MLLSFNKGCCQDTVKSYKITVAVAALVLKRYKSNQNQYRKFQAGAGARCKVTYPCCHIYMDYDNHTDLRMQTALEQSVSY